MPSCFSPGLAGHLLEVADAGGFHFRLLDAHRNGDFTDLFDAGLPEPIVDGDLGKADGFQFLGSRLSQSAPGTTAGLRKVKGQRSVYS
jgi:hypothetical protein